ncbi:MAG: ABC transporter ATP-binding protein [Limnobacter sp.]|nr:ABC transporter ATP-binding protein [Limnobacter sp.]
MNSSPTTILVQDVSYSWGASNALSKLDLSIRQGELFGLLGPNGAGKTTLISLLAGLLQPSEGKVELFGLDVQQHTIEIRKQMGFVFQSLSLDRFMTVIQNLEFSGGLQGLSKPDIHRRIDELEAEVQFKAWLHKPVAALSGGQKRLVDIVRALLHKPKILILDEPTTALDPASKRLIWDSLRILQTQEQITILIATHLMDEAQDCDRVAFLQNGIKEWEGTPEQALDEMPNQEMTYIRKASLADWFIWKLKS